MGWYLDQERIAQAAAFLIGCGKEQRIQYLKLLKLLYWADRESLREAGVPITGDTAVAMKNGPVLSNIYDYIKGEDLSDHTVWDRYFRKDGYELVLTADPGMGKLSRYDRRILKTAYETHQGQDGFEMSESSHEFPEWEAANARRKIDGRGAVPIRIEDTLAAVGCSQEQIDRVAEAQNEERQYFQFFSGVTSESDSPAR